jgi:hypothetical protein
MRAAGKEPHAFQTTPPLQGEQAAQEWLPFSGRGAVSSSGLMAAAQWREWRGVSQLWLAALRAGGVRLWFAAERARRRLFLRPRAFYRFLTIAFSEPPSALHEELAWLRALGLRDVALPIAQAGSEACREQALLAVHNLKAEDCRIGLLLREKPGVSDHPDAWRAFCAATLAQNSWQVEWVQLGAKLEELSGGSSGLDTRHLFDCVPRLRADYPGVAFLPPAIATPHRPAVIRAALNLLPNEQRWDGLTLRLDANERLNGRAFLLQLALAAAIGGRAEIFSGQMQLHFAAPASRGADVDEAAQGLGFKRLILALASGVVDRALCDVTPLRAGQPRGALASAAWRELVAHFEGARFIRRLKVGNLARDYVLVFQRRDNETLLAAWSEDGARVVRAGLRVRAARDFLGRTIPLLPFPRLRLTETLAYFVCE